MQNHGRNGFHFGYHASHHFCIKYCPMRKVKILVGTILFLVAGTFLLLQTKTPKGNRESDDEDNINLPRDTLRFFHLDHKHGKESKQGRSGPVGGPVPMRNGRFGVIVRTTEQTVEKKARPLKPPTFKADNFAPQNMQERTSNNVISRDPLVNDRNTLQRPPVILSMGNNQKTKVVKAFIKPFGGKIYPGQQSNSDKNYVKLRYQIKPPILKEQPRARQLSIPAKNSVLRGQIMPKANAKSLPYIRKAPVRSNISGYQMRAPAVNMNLNHLSQKSFKGGKTKDISIIKRDGNMWKSAEYICENLPSNMPNVAVPTPLGNVQIHGSVTETFDTENTVENFEMRILAGFQKVVMEYPRSLIIDVGSGYGVYTIMAARMGHHVVSVEQNIGAIPGLCTSIRFANYAHLVTIINMNANTKTIPGDGGKHAAPPCSHHLNLNALTEITALRSHRDAVIRISPRFSFAEDLLICAMKIFKLFDVKTVSMPWTKTPRRDAKDILKLFSSLRMSPYEPDTHQEMLNSSDMSRWPNIVVWKKGK